MNPASIDAMSWEMAEVYGAITDQIVINLAHYFPYLTAGKHPPKSMFDYQAAMLAQMGKINAQTMQIIRNNLSDADRALSASLETAIADAIKDSEPALYRGAKAGIFKPPTKPVLSANQTRAFGLYYKQAADKLNLVNTVMLESTQSAYMQTVSNVISEYEILERLNRTQIALDVAAGETITGVSSWNTAVRHATQRMKDGGITGFIDHAGRHWDAETYVAMDVRTTMFNSGRAAVWETNEGFGNDLYIVSYHNGARPLCYDWQNKVISANNVSRDVADLDGNVVHVYAQNETTYGEPAGLFGINCKHYPTPFVPGVSAVRGQVQDKAENDKQYAESQKQRALERNLREQKRDLEMMKAQNAPEDVIRAQREKVRAASKDIDDFCDETGRVRRRNRESVYTKRDFPSGNYDPSQFAREQQKRFDDYWKNGGTQSGFTFGQLTQNGVVTGGVSNVASQATTTGAQTRDYEAEIQGLIDERSEINKKMRFDDDPELARRRTEINHKIDKLRGEQRAAEKAAKQAKEAEAAAEETKRRKAKVSEIDDKIKELEQRRFKLIESGSDDWKTTDSLYSEIERLEDKKRYIEKGGWTIEEAKITRGVHIANKGSTSELTFDAETYTMPDGMRFVFKRGMNVAHQTLEPEELIRKYYETPEGLRKRSGQKVINVVDRYNPADAYWRKTYRNFSHSYMTGGDEITIWRHDYEHNMSYLTSSLRHEMGHGLDRMNAFVSTSQEWKTAMQADKDFSGGVANSVSKYGENSVKEDFAEAIEQYTGDAAAFETSFPNRASIIKRLLGATQ